MKQQGNKRLQPHKSEFRNIAIAILATTMMWVGSAVAQSRFEPSAWAGLSMSQIDGDDAGSYNHLGLTVGIESTFALGEGNSPLRGMVGIGFVQKGSHVQAIGRNIGLSYVEIPLMLTATMLQERLRLSAGVAPAILVRASVTDDGVANAQQSDNYRRLDALPLRLGLRYLFTDHLGLEATYSNSLLPITKQSGSGTYRIVRTNQGAFNRLITIAVVYHL